MVNLLIDRAALKQRFVRANAGNAPVVKDDDFIKTVEYTSKLKDGSVKPIVSSGNCIISIVDVAMENAPGVAARVFKTLAEANVQIMLITTSESQISVLVTRADFDDAVDSLSRQFV